MRRLGTVLLWLSLGPVLLALAAWAVLMPFLGMEGASLFLLFGMVSYARKLATALTFQSTLEGGVPRSQVLAARLEVFGEAECDNFTIVRLPLDAPNAPVDWVPPPLAGWVTTPAEMSIRLAQCDLDADLLRALRDAQSEPGSFVMNARDGFDRAWLYSPSQRIAVSATCCG